MGLLQYYYFFVVNLVNIFTLYTASAFLWLLLLRFYGIKMGNYLGFDFKIWFGFMIISVLLKFFPPKMGKVTSFYF